MAAACMYIAITLVVLSFVVRTAASLWSFLRGDWVKFSDVVLKIGIPKGCPFCNQILSNLKPKEEWVSLECKCCNRIFTRQPRLYRKGYKVQKAKAQKINMQKVEV